MHVMNKEAKEVFRRKCVDSYQTRVLKKTQATETNGEVQVLHKATGQNNSTGLCFN